MCAQGMLAALGAAHQFTLLFSIALALLLAQSGELDGAAALYRVQGDVGPQVPQTLKDVRALAALLRERGRGAEAAALERAFSL